MNLHEDASRAGGRRSSLASTATTGSSASRRSAASKILFIAQTWLIYDLTGSPLYLALGGPGDRDTRHRLQPLWRRHGRPRSTSGGCFRDPGVHDRHCRWRSWCSALTGAVAALACARRRLPHRLRPGFQQPGPPGDLSPARAARGPDQRRQPQLDVWQGTRILAPAAGGVLIAVAGVSVTFLVCALGYLPFALFVRTLNIERQPSPKGDRSWARSSRGRGTSSSNPLFAALDRPYLL